MSKPDAPEPAAAPAPRFEAQRGDVVARLNERIKQMKCPMCSHETFSLVGGYLGNPLQPQLGGLTLGGPQIPTAAIVCENCGFLSQHALGTLGLLPPKGGDK